jgi:hypothetical protein
LLSSVGCLKIKGHKVPFIDEIGFKGKEDFFHVRRQWGCLSNGIIEKRGAEKRGARKKGEGENYEREGTFSAVKSVNVENSCYIRNWHSFLRPLPLSLIHPPPLFAKVESHDNVIKNIETRRQL